VICKLRDRLRPFLPGAASLFDPAGQVTYRAMRDALPDPDDTRAIRGHFEDAGKLISDAMREDVGRDH
jgi:hypothetical protein